MRCSIIFATLVMGSWCQCLTGVSIPNCLSIELARDNLLDIPHHKLMLQDLVQVWYWLIICNGNCPDSTRLQILTNQFSVRTDGYNVFFKIRTAVTPIPVTTLDFQQSMTESLILTLEEAFDSASCPVKAFVIANPHNPLGKCYSKSVLGACLRFCQRRDIHFISDEVFALSTFESADQPNATPFVSALAIDPSALGCDPWRIHIVWSMSKDLGCSGIKIVGSLSTLWSHHS